MSLDDKKVSFYYGERGSGKSMFMENHIIIALLEYEVMLNTYSKKRYHLGECGNGLVSLVEVIKMAKERVIISGCTPEQMLGFLRKTIQVTIDESELPSSRSDTQK